MTSHLVPCPGCDRHIRVSEALCPFCGEALPTSLQRRVAQTRPKRRLGRAAQFAFGAVVAGTVAATGCGGDDRTTGDAGGMAVTDSGGGGGDGGDSDGGGMVGDDAGGMMGDDAGGMMGDDAGSASDSGPNLPEGGPVPAYGGPAFDAGPAEDAGFDAGGGAMTLYGAPPA